jgi:endoglucanase
LYQALEKTANEYEIPIYKEYSPSMSGTDAYGVQVAEEGIPVVEIGIPLRYMHTPVEQVAIKDIQRAGRLMAEFITNLPLDFMNTVKWE